MIFAVLLSSIFGVVAAIATVVVFISRHRSFNRDIRRFKTPKSLGKSESRQRLMNVSGVKEFSLEELVMATKNFEEGAQVGQGGYGRVYRGVLGDGLVVAIKRAKEGSRQGQDEFYTEIELLSRLHHCNLVSLLGYCIDHDEQMLVYEYMPNGTLKDRLADSGEGVLDFASRLRVAMGAAKGIRYLHVEANPPIFHRDIKASNILLDERNNPRVADFGLSRLAPPPPDFEGISTRDHVSTVVKGTPGYLDPEYFLTHKLTDKSDVYSFGVVLLELITGMQPITNGKNIVREVKHAFDTGQLLSVVDAQMGSYRAESLAPLVRLALSCCKEDTSERPSMNEVVHELESIWHLVPWSDSLTTFDTDSLSSMNSSQCKVDVSNRTKVASPLTKAPSHKSLGSTKNPFLSTDYDTSEIFSLEFQANVIPR